MVIFLVLLIIYFVIKLFSQAESKQEVIPMPIQSVKKAAEASLSSFEEWRGPTLKERYTFYDLNKQPSAYLYNISDYYGRAGYVTISATTKLEPIIEVSNSEVTPVAKIIELVNDITLGTIYDASDIKAEYLYLGGTEYYAKLTLREGSNTTVKYYQIQGDSTSEVNETFVNEKQKFFSTYKEEHADEKWLEFVVQP